MLGGTHDDIGVSVPNTNTTSVGSAHNIGVHNTTSVGSTHNTNPVGDAHNTTPVGEAHKPPVLKAHMASQTELEGTTGPLASMSPAKWAWLRALGMPPHASPISLWLRAGS